MATKKSNGSLEGWLTWVMIILGVALMTFGSYWMVRNDDQEHALKQLLSDTRAGAAVVTTQSTLISLGNDQWKSMGDTFDQVKAAYDLIGKGGKISPLGPQLPTISNSVRLSWTQAGQSLSTFNEDIKTMQGYQNSINADEAATQNWFNDLKEVAINIESLQNQGFARQEPWASLLNQQRQFLESLPKDASQLSNEQIKSMETSVNTVLDLTKNVDPSLKNSIDPYQHAWTHLGSDTQIIEKGRQVFQSIQALQPKLIADSLQFQRDLLSITNHIEPTPLWIRWIWIILGLLSIIVSASLMLYFSQTWIQQATRGRIQARRTERLEASAQDLVRQMSSLYVGEALRLNSRIDPPEDRNSILIPLVEMLNQTLQSISKIMNQAEQRLSEIHTSTSEADDHIRSLLNFSHDHKELMQALDQRTHFIQEKVEQAQQAWKALQNQELLASEKGSTGQEIVQASQATTDSIRQALQDAAKRIKRLGESTQSIIQNTAMIRKLTREMHVLSTNAAIEVAAVGEKGRKFGVVAQEIQRLSKNTNQVIIEIEEWVSKVQEDAQGAISSMEISTGGVVRTAVQNEQANEVLKELHRILNESEQYSSEIGQSFAELVNGTRNWLNELQSDTIKSEEVHHHVLSTSASLEKSQQALSSLKKTTSQLSTQG